MANTTETIIVESYSHECEGEGTLHPLLKKLRDDKVVKSLYLMNLPLGDKGAQLVADMLKANATLETLYLNGNAICDAGVARLATALETNTTLKKLSLSDNVITDEGMNYLGRSLARNTSGLQELKLCDNRITSIGRCWGHVSLSKLNLHGNTIRNVPNKYLGQRRVSKVKMHALKKFLNEKNEQIEAVESRVLDTESKLPNQDDVWRMKTLGYHNEFKVWLDDLVCDHKNFNLLMLGIHHDKRCNLARLRHGYRHLVRDIFSFLFVGVKHYDFARVSKVLRLVEACHGEQDDDDNGRCSISSVDPLECF